MQEALLNVVKHADGDTAHVTLDRAFGFSGGIGKLPHWGRFTNPSGYGGGFFGKTVGH